MELKDGRSPGLAAGIVGTFDVENYGDLLFPLIAEKELQKRISSLALRVYSPTVPDANWPFPVRKSSDLVDDAPHLAAVLLGGGQLIRNDATYPFSLPEGQMAPDSYCLNPALAAEAAGTPLIWNAIGAWTGSPPCPAREAELGRLVSNSAIAAVRDEHTRNLFARLAPSAPVEMVPDTAFGLSSLWPKRGVSPDQERWKAELGISSGYIVVQADRRIARFRDILAQLQQHLQTRIVVLPICYCHGDRAEGFPALPGDTDRIGGWPPLHRIREIIAGSDLVVATSLHAAITAISYGIRVARVHYPYERKFELLNGFEGVARLDNPKDLERLLLRKNDTEQRLHDYQASLSAYWDRIAAVIQANKRGEAKPLDLPKFPAPVQRRPLKVEARAAAGRLVRKAMRGVTAMTRKSRPAKYRDRPLINLDAIRNSQIHAEPFRWGHQTGLFDPADAARLAQEFPTNGFWTIAGIEPGRHYNFRARSLISMGADHPSGMGGLSDAWQAFALDLLSPDYRAAVSKAVGLDLKDAVLEANITQYGQGHELSPHIDLKEKLVTQIFYFNTDWTEADGGCLAIMSSERDHDDAAVIPPMFGTSAILVRSHRSWHRVTPVREGLERHRRSLNVIFHLPDSRSTMWPQWPIATHRTLHRWASPAIRAWKWCRPSRQSASQT